MTRVKGETENEIRRISGIASGMYGNAWGEYDGICGKYGDLLWI